MCRPESKCTSQHRHPRNEVFECAERALRPAGARGTESAGAKPPRGCEMVRLPARGFCEQGFYAGSDPYDATPELCHGLCLSEPQCRFVALAPGKTCNRYDARAGECNVTRRRDHLLFRKPASCLTQTSSPAPASGTLCAPAMQAPSPLPPLPPPLPPSPPSPAPPRPKRYGAAVLYHGEYYRTDSQGQASPRGFPKCSDYFAAAANNEATLLQPLRDAFGRVAVFFHTLESGCPERDRRLVSAIRPVGYEIVPRINSTRRIVDSYLSVMRMLDASSEVATDAFVVLTRFDVVLRWCPSTKVMTQAAGALLRVA